MVTLQAHLFALIALGMTWRCEEVVGQLPDAVPVVLGDGVSSLFGCARCSSKTAIVSFNKLKARGPDSDVVYQRVTLTEERLQYARTMTVNLPSVSVVECARAASREGLDAFVFDGSCTSYQLGAPLFKCSTDNLVIFVRMDKLADEALVLRLADAPYKMVELEGHPRAEGPLRQYMLSAVVERQSSTFYAVYTPFEINSWPPCCAHLITLENGDTFAVWAVMDLSSCLTDGDDGVPLLLATYLYNFTSPVVYFLNECGNTIRIPNLNQFGFMMTYSHEGFGCVYYPSEAADECTVTFESEDPVGFGLEVRSYFPELEDGCTGFNMTITGSTLHSNQTETINACRQYGTFELGGYRTYTASLLQHPSKRANGFELQFKLTPPQ